MEFGIPSYLEAPPDRLPQPPTVTREQILPFHALTWENFERLCLRLVRREAEIYQCFLYGERGQKQRGIDIIAYCGDLPQREVCVYQCKREEEFGASEIRKAVDKFIEGKWDPQPSTFIICSSASLRATECQDEILKQTKVLSERNVRLGIWNSETLSEKLKAHADLVDDFFDRPWVVAFNGEDAVNRLGSRLSGQQILTLRGRLFNLYATLFERHDPGLARSLLERPVPFLKRYVPADIAEHRAVTFTASLSSGSGLERISEESERIGSVVQAHQPDAIRREHPISQREFSIEKREPVLQWLPKGNRAVVLGEPGAGKSALLRFIALTLLDPVSIHEDLARIWGERLPIWISFSAWTRAIAHNEAISLEDFLFTWLHQHSADDLRVLVSQSLKDHRLLLLIDGLDERYNEEGGKVALDRLEAFLAVREIPTILTARPAGYERVRRPSGQWRHGRLLELNDLQLKSIAHFWLSWLGSSAENAVSTADAALTAAAEKQTAEFLEQLDAAPRIRELARVPLLLLLFIEVIRSKGRIPEHRIKAYDTMVDYLISVHPALRSQAAGLTKADEEGLTPDEIKEAMARLALRIQENHGGGYAPTETCQEVLTQFLNDPVDGLGYHLPEARKRANRLVQIAKEGLGLLVERGVNELGFIYLTLQEYLAALAIARKPEAEQEETLDRYWKDPRWREVILALIGITGLVRRDRLRLEKLVDHLRIQPRSELEQWKLRPLLSEIVFGEMGLAPARAGGLATEVMDTVEQCPFHSLREALVPMVVQGLRSDYLRETVKSRLQTWFPARLSYVRRDLLLGTMSWEPAEDSKRTLLIALNDEDAACRIAAATALATVFREDSPLGSILLSYACRAINPALREASLFALSEGWGHLNGLPDVFERALAERHPGIRLSAVLGRIVLGLNTKRDLNILWILSGWQSGLDYGRKEEIVPAIIKGWPQSPEVREACLKILREQRNTKDENVDMSQAAIILSTMFPGDDEVAEALAEQIRATGDVRLGDSHRLWPVLAQSFRHHPLLIGPVSDYLRRRRERYKAIYPGRDEKSAIVIAGTPELKADLFASFVEKETSVFQYWITAALVEAWPEDEDVKEFLRIQLDGPPKTACEVAPFIDSIGFEPTEERQRLLAIIRNPNTPRVWIAFETLLRISPTDEELLETGLTALKSPRHFYDDQHLKRLLIESFSSDPRVESLARELWDDIDSWPGFLARIYGSHPLFRPAFLAAMRPMDAAVRTQLVGALGASYIPSVHALPILKEFIHEQDNAAVRTLAAVSLADHAAHESEALKTVIDTFTVEVNSVGHIYEMRRSSAIAGLLRLGRIDVIRALEDPKVYVSSLHPNLPYYTEILRHWHNMKGAFGEEIFKRFGDGESEFWETVGPLISEFDSAREEFLTYLKTIAGKPVGPNTLQAMAEVFPKSNVFRETCIETLQSSNLPPDATFAAARLIGQNFGKDTDTYDRIRYIKDVKYGPRLLNRFTHWRILLALCYGWTDASEVQEWINKSQTEWEGMPWHIALHLHRIAGKPGEFLKVTQRILKQNENRSEVRDPEISHALRLWAGDENNRLRLVPLIESSNSSLAVTALALLSTSGPIIDSLRASFESLFEKELKAGSYPPRIGIDLSTGLSRVLSEVIFDPLGSDSTWVGKEGWD